MPVVKKHVMVVSLQSQVAKTIFKSILFKEAPALLLQGAYKLRTFWCSTKLKKFCGKHHN